MLARIATAALAFATTSALAALPDYDVVSPVPLGVVSWAYDVSGNGIVVGCYGNTATAYKWQDGVRTDLGPGCASAVNSSGLVGGHDTSGNIQFWSGSSVIALNRYGTVNAINDSGVAVGTYWDLDSSGVPRTPHPFMYANGQLTELPATCSVDINSSGQVLCSGGPGASSAAIYQNGTLTPIPGPDGGNTFAAAAGIDDRGEVVGLLRGLLLYSGGVTRAIPNTPPYANAVDLTSSGILVGDDEYPYAGFIADADSNLRYFRDMGFTGWVRMRPYGVGENGWIVGMAANGPHASPEAFILVPRGTATSPPAVQPQPPVTAAKRLDLNADTKGDLLWRGPDASYGAWLMDGAHPTSAAGLAAPVGATLVARGDFDGDGRTDIVWKDAADDYYMSLMSGTSMTTARIFYQGGGWQAIGAGDFDGDGKSDLLWWNASQGYGVWLMNGTSIKYAGSLSYPPTATTPAALGDFNGDGRDAILWKGDDGHFELYTMDGLAATPAGTVRAAGSGFNVVALGDFNGDHRTDIVWGHADGTQSLWLMNGASTTDSAGLVPAGSGWSVALAVDLDADGLSDLVWKHADGSVGGWLMNGTTMRDYRAFLGPASGWSVAAANDLDGNGTADLVWRYTDGSYGVWLMSGLAPSYAGVVLDGGSGWEVVP